MTTKEKIAELNSERASVEAQFREAGRVQDACRTRYAEIKGAIDVLTEMSSEENE